MKKLKYLLGLGAVLTALPIYLWAQTIGQQTLSGNECWNAGQGPGGPSTGFVCTNMIRNTTGTITTATTTGAFNATTATSVYLFTAALGGAVTFNAPASPVADGYIMEIANGTGSNFGSAITFTPAAGQSVVGTAAATLNAGTSFEFRYVLATTTWYRVR